MLTLKSINLKKRATYTTNSKTKTNFIFDLLNNSRLTVSLKEKILKLASYELKDNPLNIEISERLSVIENEIKSLKIREYQQEIEVVPLPKKAFLPPNPENTKNFLTYFRDSEGLKYLTHEFKDPSDPPDRMTLLKQAKEDLETALSKYPSIPEGLKRRIEEFAFKEEPSWFIRKGLKKIFITDGWSSTEFAKWYDNQEPENITHPSKDAKWNKQIIQPFKKSIQIRDGLLYEIIEENIDLVFSREEKKLFEIKFDETNLKLADFYTDVDALGLAIYHLLSKTKEVGLKSSNFEIAIEFIPEFENKFKCIKIQHLNSIPTKSLDDGFKGGSFYDVFNLLKGLCNWSIEAKFGSNNIRNYFLYDKSIKSTRTIITEETKGFTNLLLFY